MPDGQETHQGNGQQGRAPTTRNTAREGDTRFNLDLFHVGSLPLEHSCAGQLFGDLVGGDQHDGAYNGVEQAHCGGQPIVWPGSCPCGTRVLIIGKLVMAGLYSSRILSAPR